MRRRPPTSTLFPYTTLFRSAVRRNLGTPERSIIFLSGGADSRGILGSALRAVGATAQEDDRPDRKSTRLNSSHANISYAVFCLKKKKRNNETNTTAQIRCSS